MLDFLDSAIVYIAVWGGVLSTILAFIRVWEFWSSRFRIDVGYGFSDGPGMANNIFIRNLSDKPIILVYWELFYRSHLWPLKSDAYINSSGEDFNDRPIPSNTSETLSFTGMDHFSWSNKAMKSKRIYMRLHIAGRRPFLKRVYG